MSRRTLLCKKLTEDTRSLIWTSRVRAKAGMVYNEQRHSRDAALESDIHAPSGKDML